MHSNGQFISLIKISSTIKTPKWGAMRPYRAWEAVFVFPSWVNRGIYSPDWAAPPTIIDQSWEQHVIPGRSLG
jgi:hypothetical protein